MDEDYNTYFSLDKLSKKNSEKFFLKTVQKLNKLGLSWVKTQTCDMTDSLQTSQISKLLYPPPSIEIGFKDLKNFCMYDDIVTKTIKHGYRCFISCLRQQDRVCLYNALH